MIRILARVLPLLLVVGCAVPPPRLAAKSDLIPNVGQMVRVEGIAHFYKVNGGCPSVATDEFEVFVYPRNLWGLEMQGKKVAVTGRLASTTRTPVPDPYINTGEYWLSDSTFILVTAEAK